MKKLTAVLSVILAICLLCSITVFAESTDPDEPDTEVLDIDSVEAEDLARQDSYILTDDGAPVLIVEHHTEVEGAKAALSRDTGSGYYTAEFCIPDTSKKVFLTGLTRDNVAEIEEAFITSSATGADFELVDLGFIDTEKTYKEDEDDEMCWAAATANILAYTGWGAQAGFNSEDDLFELFISNFENKGGSTGFGIEWFFDGIDHVRVLQSRDPYYDSFTRVVNYPNSGSYFPDYTFDTFTERLDLEKEGAEGLGELLRQLKGGRGAELGLDLYRNGGYSNGEFSNGHAVTCWGMVTDTDYPVDDKAHYDSILITDSDTGEFEDDRREAHDVMDVNVLTPCQDSTVDSYEFDIGGGYTAFISDATTLKPYSSDAPKEDEESTATRNRRTNPDIVLNKVALSTVSTDTVSEMKVFPAGSTVYFCPYFPDNSDVDYYGAFKINYTLKNSRGTTVANSSLNFGVTNLPCYYDLFLQSPQVLARNLSAGLYTLTLEANPNHAVTEAYWFNNTYTTTFAVGDAYVLGDVDDDDDVNSVDSALILRSSAGFAVELDSRAAVRGDVNTDGDMNIIDATYVQRHLAEIATPCSIDSVLLYS